MLQFLCFEPIHTIWLPLGVQNLPSLSQLLSPAWVFCSAPAPQCTMAPGLFGHQPSRDCTQTDTPWLARTCYKVLQSGQKHLLKKPAATANTHLFRFCSNFLLCFTGHVGMLMLYYPQGISNNSTAQLQGVFHSRLEPLKKLKKFLPISLL